VEYGAIAVNIAKATNRVAPRSLAARLFTMYPFPGPHTSMRIIDFTEKRSTAGR
jgi:hypothetical protein